MKLLLLLALSSVAGAQTLVITATPTSADVRATPALTWSGIPSSSTCIATGGWSGTKPASGGAVVQLEIVKTTRYALTCSWPAVPGSGGAVTVNWTAPTTNTDGSALTNLARYNVVYGTSPGALAATQTVTAPATFTTITGLTAATWYFAVVAENTDGIMSVQSNVVSKAITTSTGSPAGSTSAYVDVTIRPAPLPPVLTTIAVVANQPVTPVFRVLGSASKGYYLDYKMYGQVPIGRECTGPQVASYRGKAFRRVFVQAIELWGTTSNANLAAACG